MSRRKTAAYRRTRKDHATEVVEDYVEAIAEITRDQGSCRVRNLAEHFGVSHVTVSQRIRRLREDGYVANERYRPIRLTARGRRLAAKARERHEIVLRFLRAIGVDPATAEIDAEGLEHHVSPETLERFRLLADRELGPERG